MMRKRKPFFGPKRKVTKEEKVKIFKRHMASSYSLPRFNTDFNVLGLVVPAVVYACGYGVFIYLLVKGKGASVQAQNLAFIFGVLFGVTHALFSRILITGFQVERLLLIFIAGIYFMVGKAIVNVNGW